MEYHVIINYLYSRVRSKFTFTMYQTDLSILHPPIALSVSFKLCLSIVSSMSCGNFGNIK